MLLSGVRRRALVALGLTIVLPCSLGLAPSAMAQAQKDRVRVPFPAYDGTLTPYTHAIGYPLVTLVYDTLMLRDTAGKPQPWLARSITRSADGRTVTIRLRDGVRWHDGRPLSAADVAFTYRFVASRYQPRFTPQLQDIARVRAPSRLTAVFELRRPSLGFDDQPLADVPILPRHLWRGLAAGAEAPSGLPVGSGPYRLISEDRTRGYVMRANDGYFKGMPRVREIRVPIDGNADDTYDDLRERRVDMVPLTLVAPVARSLGSTIGLAVRRGPQFVGTMLVLNQRRAPFNKLAARKAVAGALDLDRIVRRVAPAVAAGQGFIHPSSRWAAGVRLRPPAPTAEGRSALNAQPLRVLAPSNDPVRLEAGTQVVAALRRDGVRATLVERSRAELDRAIGGDGSAPDFDAAIETIPALVSHDPDGLTRLFGSDPRIAPLNIGGYGSEEFDALARRVASADDVTERRSEIRAEQAQLAKDVPAIALFFTQGTFAYSAIAYDGWTFAKGDGLLNKRSFLPGAAQPAAPEASQEPATKDAAESGSGAISLFYIISLIVLAGVLIVAGIAFRQYRRDRAA